MIFSTTFVWNISHFENKWAKYDSKCLLVFVYSTRYSFRILMTPEFSRQFFWKIIKYQISRKSVHWEPSCSMCTVGWTDRHETAYSRFLQFCEWAWKLFLTLYQPIYIDNLCSDSHYFIIMFIVHICMHSANHLWQVAIHAARRSHL